MSIYELALLIHIVLFCYWLGGDVGVFYSSRFVDSLEGAIRDKHWNAFSEKEKTKLRLAAGLAK